LATKDSNEVAQFVGGRLSELADQIGKFVSQKPLEHVWFRAMSFSTSNQAWKFFGTFDQILDVVQTSIGEVAQFLIHLEYNHDQGLKLVGKFAKFLNIHIFSRVSGWVS